jgi:hypothetical protein
LSDVAWSDRPEAEVTTLCDDALVSPAACSRRPRLAASDSVCCVVWPIARAISEVVGAGHRIDAPGDFLRRLRGLRRVREPPCYFAKKR